MELLWNYKGNYYRIIDMFIHRNRNEPISMCSHRYLFIYISVVRIIGIDIIDRDIIDRDIIIFLPLWLE